MAAKSTIAEIRQKLIQNHRETLRVIGQIDETIAWQRPRPDAWSIKDHVIHLVAVEESVIHFAHRMLNEDCPISPLCFDKAFNQDAWNNREVAERADTTWPQAIQALQQTFAELLALLDTTGEGALGRVGSHPIWGTPVTLASVLRIPYRHERAHRDEVAALVNLLQQRAASEK